MLKLVRKSLEEDKLEQPLQEGSSSNQFFGQDVARIVKALKYGGYETSEADAAWAWSCYSGDFCAGWLGLPEKDENILERVLMYLDLEKTA